MKYVDDKVDCVKFGILAVCLSVLEFSALQVLLYTLIKEHISCLWDLIVRYHV